MNRSGFPLVSCAAAVMIRTLIASNIKVILLCFTELSNKSFVESLLSRFGNRLASLKRTKKRWDKTILRFKLITKNDCFESFWSHKKVNFKLVKNVIWLSSVKLLHDVCIGMHWFEVCRLLHCPPKSEIGTKWHTVKFIATQDIFPSPHNVVLWWWWLSSTHTTERNSHYTRHNISHHHHLVSLVCAMPARQYIPLPWQKGR